MVTRQRKRGHEDGSVPRERVGFPVGFWQLRFDGRRFGVWICEHVA